MSLQLCYQGGLVIRLAVYYLFPTLTEVSLDVVHLGLTPVAISKGGYDYHL